MNPTNTRRESLPKRLWVVGPCGAGKSEVAVRVAAALGVRPTHIDDLTWLPGWRIRPREDTTRILRDVVKRAAWVIDGNIGRNEAALWELAERADRIVWLDLPLRVTWPRILKRTWRRIVSGEPCCQGNRETLRRALFSRHSIVWYALCTHRRSRATYAQALAARPHLRWTSARAVEAWLDDADTAPTMPDRDMDAIRRARDANLRRHAAVRVDGKVAITMEPVHGEDLREIFARVHRGEEGWTVTRVLGLMLRLCEIMADVHAKGVIHRDLKPTKVMVGDRGEVYVMDWHLARALGAKNGENIVGTPAYMSPEQAKGGRKALHPASDVYAAGVMLYELLTGRIPYLTPDVPLSPQALLRRKRKGPPALLNSLAPEVPAGLTAICEKAMARDVAHRYPDMSALAKDLRAYLEHGVASA